VVATEETFDAFNSSALSCPVANTGLVWMHSTATATKVGREPSATSPSVPTAPTATASHPPSASVTTAGAARAAMSAKRPSAAFTANALITLTPASVMLDGPDICATNLRVAWYIFKMPQW
jgi:hypothetical protein